MNMKRNGVQFALALCVFGSSTVVQASAQSTEELKDGWSEEQSSSVDADGSLVYYDTLEDGALTKQIIFGDGTLGDPVVVRAPRASMANRVTTNSDCRVTGCPSGLRCVRLYLFGRNPYGCRPPRAPVSAGPTVTITGGQMSGGPGNLSHYLQK